MGSLIPQPVFPELAQVSTSQATNLPHRAAAVAWTSTPLEPAQSMQIETEPSANVVQRYHDKGLKF